jgi:hypothetical protein
VWGGCGGGFAFATGDHFLAHTELRLSILLSQPLKHWDCRHAPPCPAALLLFWVWIESQLKISCQYAGYLSIMMKLRDPTQIGMLNQPGPHRYQHTGSAPRTLVTGPQLDYCRKESV